MAPSCIPPQGSDEAPEPTFGITAVVAAHDGFDGFTRLICVIEGNGANVMVQDMGFDDAVEEMTPNEAHLSVDCGSRSTCEGPGMGCVVRQSGISMLEVGDCNCAAR